MTDRKEICNKAIKIIEKAFQEMKPDLLIAGIVGSAYLTDIHGDIDVFVILSESQESQEKMMLKHKETVQVFDVVKRKLRDNNIAVSIFTEFRMEEFSRYLRKSKEDEDFVLIHLKIYPTPNSIEYWQTNAVAKGYFSNIVSVLYEKNNAYKKLRSSVDQFPDPSAKTRIEFLRALSYETYEYLRLSDLPPNLLLYEGFNKFSFIS